LVADCLFEFRADVDCGDKGKHGGADAAKASLQPSKEEDVNDVRGQPHARVDYGVGDEDDHRYFLDSYAVAHGAPKRCGDGEEAGGDELGHARPVGGVDEGIVEVGFDEEGKEASHELEGDGDEKLHDQGCNLYVDAFQNVSSQIRSTSEPIQACMQLLAYNPLALALQAPHLVVPSHGKQTSSSYQGFLTVALG